MSCDFSATRIEHGPGVDGHRRRGSLRRETQDGERIATATSVGDRSGASFDDEWRRWIAENLMLVPAREHPDILIAKGFPAELATHEIDLAAQSPYIKGSELLLNRLRKRDWLLAFTARSTACHPRNNRDPTPAQALARRIPRANIIAPIAPSSSPA